MRLGKEIQAMSRKTILVAVGVVINSDCKILVAKRHSHADHGGLWEFPGGKVEANEPVYDALCRELTEEVSLEVLSASPLIQIAHTYNKYDVLLDVWRVDAFNGEAQGAEGQVVRWVDVNELSVLQMPEANQQIINILNPTTT